MINFHSFKFVRYDLKLNFFPYLPQLFNHDQRTLDIRDLGFQSLTPKKRNEKILTS